MSLYDFVSASAGATLNDKVRNFLYDQGATGPDNQDMWFEFYSKWASTHPATNLITLSEQFDNVYWTKQGGVIAPDATLAPDGNTTGDLFTDDSTSTTHGVSRAMTVAIGQTVTWSVYVKRATSRYIVVSIRNFAFQLAGRNIVFDFDTARFINDTNPQDAGRFRIEEAANGWYRLSFVTTRNDSVGNIVAFIGTVDATGTSVTYTGDGSLSVYVWGAQFQTGGLSTTYIPTSGSTATGPVDMSGSFNDKTWKFLMYYTGAAPCTVDCLWSRITTPFA